MKGMVLAFFLAIGFVATAQAPSYVPTEIQALRLKSAKDDAIIASQDLQNLRNQLDKAQSAYTASLKAYTDAADKIKAENKWGADVQFDMNSSTFSKKPEPIKPAEPKK